MGPLSCHTGSIAVVIALPKVLDNNIVVYCILNITCKKTFVLYIYVGCIFMCFFHHGVTQILSVYRKMKQQ